jgi:pyruvate ferredoxin oxidoreductase alpha subunit
VPAFPITPQTEIIETIGNWIDNGEMDCRMVTLESEHSMLTAAGAAVATGVRVFSATSSQGLLYAMEMLYTVAGWRAPFVLVNVSRGLLLPSPWNRITMTFWQRVTVVFCRFTAQPARRCWIARSSPIV